MHDYIFTFPGKPYDWLVTVRASFTLNKAVWSSGMIPALGAGGPGIKPRLDPFLNYLLRPEGAKDNSRTQSLNSIRS